ncbi:HD domain-containing protein [Vallitalea pronyensis]|uniref:HD domain-containing protein n=1 Tax=Vallitalea pronyensis TaxID=1348613 RepID=A0A8J8SHF3_9FIRM|nr:HD domain-containing protein [Vallitalea pronyensis]QUI23516.1 HD domain-containing protein [Vallitalea pronyensis]
MDIREIIAHEMEERCKSSDNIFGYGIWSHHIVSVVKYAKMLAEKIGADIEIVEIAALLHDYASIIDEQYIKDHHLHGAREAERILRHLNYPEEKIEKVKACIIAHRGSVRIMTDLKEARCLADADAMAHIVHVPSLLYMVYVKKQLSIDEGAAWVRGKIERSWNKLTDEAKEMISDQYQSAMQVLGKCKVDEVNN